MNSERKRGGLRRRMGAVCCEAAGSDDNRVSLSSSYGRFPSRHLAAHSLQEVS